MATRSRTTFNKRQKEAARMEKSRDKAAKRMERKVDKKTGLPTEEDILANREEIDTSEVGYSSADPLRQQ